MRHFKTIARALAAGSAAFFALSSAALADGEPGYAAPAPEGRQFTYAITIGGTSDYVFRGVTQSNEDPAFQAAVDVSYGIWYAGVWGSSIDFDNCCNENAEVDLYTGIKPTWTSPLGPVNFDLGAIYYWYPDTHDFANFLGDPGTLNYVELKLGYSTSGLLIKNLSSGSTVYWSPDYAFESGDVFTWESWASYALPDCGIFQPSISGTWGTQWGDSKDGYSVGGTTRDNYDYWNAGVSLAVENFTFDFRYWDTTIDDGLADERFVFTASVTVP